MDELDKALKSIKDAFHDNRGGSIELEVEGVTYDVILIPTHLYSSRFGVTAALEGEAFFEWDGKEEIDNFSLVSGGFPLTLSFFVLELLTQLRDYLIHSRSLEQNRRKPQTHNP